MSKSETINELATALAKVQGVLTHASKDADNPFHRSKYADLASVWESCRKPLAENGLSIVQLPDGMEDNCLILDTTMLHISGQWISSRIKMPMAKQDPQGYGSTLTYARRYALAAIVGVYQDDDDAQSAQKTQGNTNVPPATQKPVTSQITELQRKQLVALAGEKALSGADMTNVIKWKYGKASSKELTELQAKYLLGNLDQLWVDYIASQAVAG